MAEEVAQPPPIVENSETPAVVSTDSTTVTTSASNSTEAKPSEAVEAKGDAAGTTAAAAPAAAPPEPAKAPTTKSLVLTGFGGYEKIKLEQRPYPEAPKEGQVMIRIRAAGINFADVSMRQGLYNPLPTLPVVMGLEAGADVVQVGPDVKKFKPEAGAKQQKQSEGDRVIVINNHGLWTEFITLPASNCVLMPDGMTYEEAAALPINYITAYHILFEFGNLRQGKSVLIHMAAGGVGIAATQLCKTVPNVTVYGTASLSKHDVIQKHGVDHPINYRAVDYVEEIRKIDPEGVDIVLDPLCGKDSVKGFDLLKPLGKIIHFGAANAVSGTSKSYWTLMKLSMGLKSFNSLQMIDKNKAMCGYHLGFLIDKPNIVMSAVESLLDLYKAGKIKPHIDTIWAFEDVGLAMSRIHDRANIGKVLLSPQKEPQQPEKK